ncbi:S-layer homology domain-containing protein [Bacillus sp. ISL-41]|uniref:S-layer homology domain-containing protein n=1 Tax=Bacillus sp. ISL-41 TaxID=2819127 RepID=UPI001BEC2705|nr:S-layer homology domain-containing protein [Bacillus sp. ISL-41]MBT2641703.1 S-layer homology domain-containing protein [Bacillus sp. ISL-41]
MPKLIRKSVSLMVLFVLLGSVLLSGVGFAKSKFKDVSDSYWALDEITFLVEQGVIGGFNDGTFRPGENITRGQAVIMISRAFKADSSKYPNPGLKDVPEKSPYFLAVKVLMGEGILAEVVKDKHLQPSKPLTRGEMASILSKAYELTGTYDGEFKDVEKSHFAYDDIQLLAANNITTGFGDKTFRPNKVITRVDFSVMLARTLDDRFKAGAALNLRKVDLVEIDTERQFNWGTNVAHIVVRAKSDFQFALLRDSVEPGMEYFSWDYSYEPIAIEKFIKNPGRIEKIGNNASIGYNVEGDELTDLKRYVTVIFYDKNKKPVAYQENIVTLHPKMIAQTPSSQIDDEGFIKVSKSDSGYNFIHAQVPEKFQALGAYYSVHGSFSDFTYNDAILAKGDRIFKITESHGASPVAFTNFREQGNTGEFHIMLVIYDTNLKPTGHVKEVLILE